MGSPSLQPDPIPFESVVIFKACSSVVLLSDVIHHLEKKRPLSPSSLRNCLSRISEIDSEWLA